MKKCLCVLFLYTLLSACKNDIPYTEVPSVKTTDIGNFEIDVVIPLQDRDTVWRSFDYNHTFDISVGEKYRFEHDTAMRRAGWYHLPDSQTLDCETCEVQWGQVYRIKKFAVDSFMKERMHY